MSLLAYNLTTAPLPLAAGVPIATLPASLSAGARGPALNVTGELLPLAAPAFALLQAQVAAGQVQYEWSGLPEYNTFSLIVGSAQEDVDDLDINIYVATAGGDDANPGTAALPLATQTEAFRRLPTAWKKAAIMHFASGTYIIPGGVNIGSPDGPDASPLQIIGTPLDSGLGALVTDGASTSSAYVAATPATVDGSYRGAFLRHVPTNSRILITDNTYAAGLTTFNLLFNFGFPVVAGEQFVVETPGTIFQNAPGAVQGYFSGGIFGVGVADVKFANDPGAPSGSLAIFKGDNVVGCCHFDGVNGAQVQVVEGASLRAEGDSVRWSNAPSVPFPGFWTFAGAYFVNGGINYAMGFGNAFMVADNSAFGLNDMSRAFMNSVNTRTSSFRADSSCDLAFLGGTIDTAPGDAVSYINNSNGSMYAFPGIFSIDNAGGNAVQIERNSSLQVVAPAGAGNVGYGFNVQNMSQLVTGIFGFGGLTSLTGALGDVLVGAVPKAYAALPYGEVNGSGPTLNRAE